MSPAAASPSPVLTRKAVAAAALPLIAANAVTPVAGLVDTAAVSLAGDAVSLAGLGLGGATMSVLFGTFYFLRMATSGQAAQADGACDAFGAATTLARALALGFAAGLAVFALIAPLTGPLTGLFQADAQAEAVAADYVRARLFGAPGAFGVFALQGWLIGVARTRAAMTLSIVQTLVNVVLTALFVLVLDWGPTGAGAATALADWATLSVGVVLFALPTLRAYGAGALAMRVRAGDGWSALMRLNAALMLRTWALTGSFVWFANSAAREGVDVLAGAQVLLQVITVIAFVLDAFAFVAESAVGRAIGAGSRTDLRRAMRITGELSAACGLVLALAVLTLGPPGVAGLVSDPIAEGAALRFLPYVALVAATSWAAFWLDGVFIGATDSKAMRNATALAALTYVALDLTLRATPLGPHGVWLAFVGLYVARASYLAVRYPALEAGMAALSEAGAARG